MKQTTKPTGCIHQPSGRCADGQRLTTPTKCPNCNPPIVLIEEIKKAIKESQKEKK